MNTARAILSCLIQDCVGKLTHRITSKVVKSHGRFVESPKALFDPRLNKEKVKKDCVAKVIPMGTTKVMCSRENA